MDNEEELENEPTGEQESIREKRIKQLAPHMYKKGQSGNPSGRPKGISLKEYAKMKLNSMTDDEREDFMNGLSKDTIWEMAEGKPKQDTEIRGTLTISDVLDNLENDRPTT